MPPVAPALRRALAGLAVGAVVALGTGTVVHADEPAPAYPPAVGTDDVVEAGQGPVTTETATDDPAEDGDDPADGGDDPSSTTSPDEGDEESAAAPTGADGAPDDDQNAAARVLVLVGTALLLGGGVVAIARRI